MARLASQVRAAIWGQNLLLNLWITDSQATTPIGMLPTAAFRLAVQFYSDSASEGNRRESTSVRSNPGWASRFSYQRKQVFWTNSPIVPCRAGEDAVAIGIRNNQPLARWIKYHPKKPTFHNRSTESHEYCRAPNRSKGGSSQEACLLGRWLVVDQQSREDRDHRDGHWEHRRSTMVAQIG